MRGLFYDRGENEDTPRLTARVTNISEREQDALSNLLHVRYGKNGKVGRRVPCFVFDDRISVTHTYGDFILTLSNGTAFIDTRTSLSPGQTITMLFPASDSHGSLEILGEVIWISSKASAHY